MRVVCLAAAGTGLIGLVDFLTGRDLVVSTLYLIPICWVTWSVNRETGWVFAGISTALWVAVNVLGGYDHFHPLIPFWNTLMLFGVFWPAVHLLSAFQHAYVGLEQTVEERTAALRQEIEDRKLAERAKIQAERLAMVGTMAAQVAHEVRNPLGAMSLNLDLVDGDLREIARQAPELAEETGTLIAAIREEVRRIDKVIRDYLLLARPRNAALKDCELNGFLRRRFALLHSTFSDAGVGFSMDLAEQGLFVQADEDQLWQVVLNLVRNGIEAMPEGGTLRVESGVSAGSAFVRLTDTGCGMTPEQKKRLFVPFATTKANGTGLGLTVVDQIVTEHRGRIECDSAPGKGTSFTVWLPLEPASRPAEERQERAPTPAILQKL